MLGSQENWEKGRDTSYFHIRKSPPISVSPARVVHSFQLSSLHWHIKIRQSQSLSELTLGAYSVGLDKQWQADSLPPVWCHTELTVPRPSAPRPSTVCTPSPWQPLLLQRLHGLSPSRMLYIGIPQSGASSDWQCIHSYLKEKSKSLLLNMWVDTIFPSVSVHVS